MFGHNGQMKDNEWAGIGNHNSAQFWEYDTRIARRLEIDPVYKHYRSNYSTFGSNPILNTDVNGDTENPIYDNQTGDFLGTDDKGIAGDAIKMNSSDFEQGMSHSDALKKGKLVTTGGGNSEDEVVTNDRILGHHKKLSSRPDYDGFVGIDEGVGWAKKNVGALDNPTPDNMLYIDAGKLDFGNLSIKDFKGVVGKPVYQNLNTFPNFIGSSYNERLRGTVYALGQVRMILLRKGEPFVKVVNDEGAVYDWDRGGSGMRKTLIEAERLRTGLGDEHGFHFRVYGTGKLHTTEMSDTEIINESHKQPGDY